MLIYGSINTNFVRDYVNGRIGMIKIGFMSNHIFRYFQIFSGYFALNINDKISGLQTVKTSLKFCLLFVWLHFFLKIYTRKSTQFLIKSEIQKNSKAATIIEQIVCSLGWMPAFAL